MDLDEIAYTVPHIRLIWGTSMAGTNKTEMLRIRVTEKLKGACENAADAAGLSFADWARAVLARGASEEWLALPQRPRSEKTTTRKRTGGKE